jgi:hypothetical protein
MPLESCRDCGYALSILDHHCRHCAAVPRVVASRPFDAKHVPQMMIAAALLGLLVYVIFFHGFG